MTEWPNNRFEWPNDRKGPFRIVPSLMLKGQLLNIIKFMGDIDWDLTCYRFLDTLNPNLACKFLSAHSFLLFQKSHCHLGNSSPNCPWYHRYWLMSWLWKSSSPGLLSILIQNQSIPTSVRLFLLCTAVTFRGRRIANTKPPPPIKWVNWVGPGQWAIILCTQW